MIIKKKAYARVGLIGNPSDGYFGKTISFLLKNFYAEIILYETPEIEILPNKRDHCRFKNIHALVTDINLYDYYGGIRLLKATVKKFADYCIETKREIEDKNFTLRYTSTIPHHVGMAGSSAIITAAFRALNEFYNVDIPKPVLANLILSVEVDELKIAAGLQDRVIQVYGGMVFMDFNKDHLKEKGYGVYEELKPKNLPLFYVAYRPDLSEVSDKIHSNIKARFDAKDKDVVDAMKYFASLAQKAKGILKGEINEDISSVINANFDKRCEITKISSANMAMVETARSVGASAKFTGSGGAIVGTIENKEMFKELEKVFKPLNIHVIKPEIKW